VATERNPSEFAWFSVVCQDSEGTKAGAVPGSGNPAALSESGCDSNIPKRLHILKFLKFQNLLGSFQILREVQASEKVTKRMHSGIPQTTVTTPFRPPKNQPKSLPPSPSPISTPSPSSSETSNFRLRIGIPLKALESIDFNTDMRVFMGTSFSILSSPWTNVKSHQPETRVWGGGTNGI
jgi:hypothetical protein